MITNIVLLFIFFFYIIFLLLIRKQLIKYKLKWFVIAVISYFLLIYAYFELINQIHFILRDKGINLEFGHASISLVLLALLCVIIYVLFILYLIYQRLMK
jgi:hypothetical protein